MNTVSVLMSSFNGEKYIREQIDSIIAQEGVDIKLLIRDDGSTDHTVSIIEEYKNITLQKGNNIGVGRSFMKLLRECEETDYYAFSDQDDIWDYDKLLCAIEQLKKYDDEPALYTCNQRCVNGDGELTEIRFPKGFPIQKLNNLLFSNLYSGCTMVFNNALRMELCDDQKIPEEGFFDHRIHDAWIACVASVIGHIIYDDAIHMSFRRHDSNQTDADILRNRKANVKRFARLNKSIIKRLLKGKSNKIHGIEMTADNLISGYGKFINAEDMSLLETVKNYRKNIRGKTKLLFGDIIVNAAPEKKWNLKIKVLLNIL